MPIQESFNSTQTVQGIGRVRETMAFLRIGLELEGLAEALERLHKLEGFTERNALIALPVQDQDRGLEGSTWASPFSTAASSPQPRLAWRKAAMATPAFSIWWRPISLGSGRSRRPISSS